MNLFLLFESKNVLLFFFFSLYCKALFTFFVSQVYFFLLWCDICFTLLSAVSNTDYLLFFRFCFTGITTACHIQYSIGPYITRESTMLRCILIFFLLFLFSWCLKGKLFLLFIMLKVKDTVTTVFARKNFFFSRCKTWLNFLSDHRCLSVNNCDLRGTGKLIVTL